jgi:hypothetical protein
MVGKPFKANNEEGYILVVTLLILVLLTVIGLAMNRNTSLELLISGNDKVHKETFIQADGGTEVAAEILELNIGCLDFAANGGKADAIANIADEADSNAISIDGRVGVGGNSLRLWQNGTGHWSENGSITSYPTDDARDIWIPSDYAAGEPHTNVTVEGSANFAQGSSILLAAGYLGLGWGMGSGGIIMKYEIHSQHIGTRQSESKIRVNWQHVVGNEDKDCNYN